MTDAPAREYTIRPAGDGSDLFEVLHNPSGQVLYRGSERLCKAKVGLRVDYAALETPRRKKKGAG